MRPILKTERLTLRPFTLDDAPVVQQLVSAREIALDTRKIPHPYPEGGAADWIATHEESHAENRVHHFAIDDGGVAGAIALIMREERIAELGYWVGVPFWGRGYATEAGRALVAHGFHSHELVRVFAYAHSRNKGSCRVLEKIGMRHEGTLRRHSLKWGEYLDLECYGVLREEWT
jgi:RimJ/RimL family protein N-acetyltransferase